MATCRTSGLPLTITIRGAAPRAAPAQKAAATVAAAMPTEKRFIDVLYTGTLTRVPDRRLA
jgi:hypothetical protein